MKTIGIIGAMEEEISLLKSNIEIVSAKNIIGTDFFMGKMFSKSVVLVRSGIGKVNSAICAQILIDMYGVDYIINVGVAGSIDESLSIGDIVISSDLVQHDFDTTVFGDPIGTIPRLHESFFKADEELVKIAKQIGEDSIKDQNIIIGRIASGDKFVSDKASKDRIWSDFKAYCVEMEGASIAQTCYLNKIPFVVIRSISDKADENALESFNTHMDKIANNSSILVQNMVEVL